MIWLVFLNSTQTSPFRHPWLRGDLPEPRVPALLFLKQIIKKIYILSTWIKLASFLPEVLFLVELSFYPTFTYVLACMDRFSKLDSPFYLTLTNHLDCKGRLSKLNSPFFLTFAYHLVRKGILFKLDLPFFLTFACDLACMGRNDKPCHWLHNTPA